MRSSILRAACLVALLLAPLLPHAVSPAATTAQSAEVPGELLAGPPEGWQLTMLASQSFEATVFPDSAGTTLRLTRLQLKPGATHAHPMGGEYDLSYIEWGTVTADLDDGQSNTVSMGEGIGQGAVRFHNESNDCAWILVVQYVRYAGGGGGSATTDATGPALPTQVSCDTPEETLADGSTNGGVPDPPGRLFLARVDWQAGFESGVHRQSGPVVYSVTSGRLRITFTHSLLDVAVVELEAGSALTVPAGMPHSVSVSPSDTEPASAYLLGMIAGYDTAVGTMSWARWDSVGPPSGLYEHEAFTLAWDLSWSLLDNYQGPTLGNGTSVVQFASGTDQTGDALACTQPTFISVDGYHATDLQPAVDPSNEQDLRGGDDSNAWAIYLFDHEGVAMTAYINCIRVVPETSGLLVITWIAPQQAYEQELPRIQSLLEHLQYTQAP